MLFNAVPLLSLAAAYAAVSAALLPALWRDRGPRPPARLGDRGGLPGRRGRGRDPRRARPPRPPAARRPPLGLVRRVARGAAARPAAPVRAGAIARSSSAGSAGRSRSRSGSCTATASSRRSPRSRTRSGGRATPVEVARPLVRHVTSLLGGRVRRRGARRREPRAGDRRLRRARRRAGGLVGGARSRPAREPSGIASAVFDAAPVTRLRRRRARRSSARGSSQIVGARERLLDPDDRRGARDRRARGRVDRREARVHGRGALAAAGDRLRRQRSRSNGCAPRRR